MRRSRSGQHRKVMEARAVAGLALGDAARRDGPHVAAKYVPTTKPAEPIHAKSEAIGVLTLREAAVRLGVTTGELEGMVTARDRPVADGGMDGDGAQCRY